MTVLSTTPTGSRPRERMLFSSRYYWIAVFLLALAVRLIELGHQNLWCDEVLTVNVSHEGGKALLEAMSMESNKPPLYFYFMHYWLPEHATEFWVRLPSAIFGALACAITLILGREIFGHKYGWMPGVILAVMPFHVYYSQEARMYALLTLTGAAAMLFNFRFCRRQQWQDALLYLLCAVSSCYVFTYGIFLIPFSCLFSLAFKPRLPRKSLLIIWAVNFLVAIFFAPWMPRLLHSVQTGHGLHTLMRASALQTGGYAFFALGLGTTFGPSTDQLRIFGRHIFTAAPGVGALFVIGLLIEMLAVVLGLWKLWQANRNAFFLALIGLGIFWGFPCLANFLKPGIPINPRYCILAVIPLAVILAGFLQWTLERGALRKVPAVFLVLSFTISLANNYFNPAYAREDIRSAARFVEAQIPPPREVIVCADFMQAPWRYYYHGPAQIVPFSVGGQPVEAALKPLAATLNGPAQFDLVYTRTDYGDPRELLPSWLQQHYRQAVEKKWTGVAVYCFDGLEQNK